MIGPDLNGNAGLLPVFDSLGDGAITVTLGEAVDPGVNDWCRALADALHRAPFPGFTEAVTGYRTVTVFYDPVKVYQGLERLERRSQKGAGELFGSLQEAVTAAVKQVWSEQAMAVLPDAGRRMFNIPVRYGGREGPDLGTVAEFAGMTEDEVVAMHSGAEYRVYMIGFTPGFPYLGGLPDALAIPRRGTPRVSVPPGAVAIGGGQTGIYPLASPGGWHLIGRTPLRLFRPELPEPGLLLAGDQVRFVPISEERYRDVLREEGEAT